MKYDLTKLTDIQKHVTQESGTEAPFTNIFCDFYDEGIYLDIVSGEVLFSSLHKFKTTCGWPAFYKALEDENIVEVKDTSLRVSRVEVRSKSADSHLGHVFNDGPAPTGIRYCINSAALQFIPKDKLKSHGLEQYLPEFEAISKQEEKSSIKIITLGAGCFWGVESILSKTKGILKTTTGYCGGQTDDPTHETISTGQTGHAEVVQIEFDTNTIPLTEVLNLFWRLHDPTTLNRQGYDHGTQYRSAIFCTNEQDIKTAQIEKDLFEQTKFYTDKLVTEIVLLDTFYPAEEYHQDYYDKKYQGGVGPICHYVRGI